MDHRERVFKTLEHVEPDRVPLDEPEGRFRSDTWAKLIEYFSINDREAILNYLGIDFRHVERGASEGFKRKAKYVGLPFDSYLKQLGENLFEDEWGVKYEPTSDRLHWRYVYHPLSEIDLDSYEFPDPDDPSRYVEAEKDVKKYRDKYVVGAHLWGSLFEQAWALRGFNLFITDLYRNPKFANKLLDRLLDCRIREAKYFIDMGVDIVQLGDDFGMQTTMIISPDIWRKYFKPRMKKLIHEIKKHSKNSVYIFYHSDGYIEPIVGDLIEIGVQILNPIQPECMNPAYVKRKWGDRLILHGTISVQTTLPFGSVEDVKNVVKKTFQECGEDGGLILAPTHSPQPETPIENIVTMYLYARKHCTY